MKIVIFGNSGSGKSTLARVFAREFDAPVLDLDTVAWTATVPPERRPFDESAKVIRGFMLSAAHWVIEGCYGDLIEFALNDASHAVFLNPGVATCVENARSRPWEPHKYDSREAQDANLAMLVDWIGDYDQREDEFSRRRHQALFDAFTGHKRELTSNAQAAVPSAIFET